jgi:exopolysaccharide production protein ExoQ
LSFRTSTFPAFDALLSDARSKAGRSLVARVLARADEAVFWIVVLISTTGPVALIQKLSGGQAPGWLGAIWAVGAFLCVGFALRTPLQTLRAMVTAWPVMLLTAWIWASLNWSENPYETLRGAVYITCSHVFACAVAARFSWRRLIEMLALVIVTSVAVSTVLAVFIPRVGQMQEIHPGAWSGIWPEKQLFGMFACHGMIASLAMVAIGKGKSWWWIGVVLCAIAIVGSTGRTALLMSIASVGIGVWFWLLHRGLVISVLTTWVGMSVAIISTLVLSLGVGPILKLLGRSSDLTGRTEIWQAVREVGNIKPLTGWGYQAIWRGREDMTSPYQWVNQWTDFEPANAHNSFLDMYLQLGLVGVGLLALIMLWAWMAVIVRASQSDIATPFAAATLMAITLICFTESNLANFMDLQWIMVPLLATKLLLGDTPAPIEPQSQMDGYFEDGSWTFDSQDPQPEAHYNRQD